MPTTELRGDLVLAGTTAPWTGVTMPVEEMHLVQDQSWAPSIAAEVTIPYTPERAAALDPRVNGHRRAWVTITRLHMGTARVADLFRFLSPPNNRIASISSSFSSSITLGDLSLILGGRDWGEGVVAPDVLRCDLTVRARRVDHLRGVIIVRLASDELLAQEPRVYLVRQQETLPSRIMALLRAGGVQVHRKDFAAGAGFIAVPEAVYDRDRSVYEHAAQVATDHGLRLVCDEQRVWRLVDPAAAPSTTAEVTHVEACTDDVDRDGDYADVIMWRGRGYQPDGTALLELRTWPSPPPPAPFKAWFHEEDYGEVGAGLPMPTDEELAARLAHLQARDRVLVIDAPADPTIRAGMGIETGLPSLPELAGVATRVEWTLPDDVMTITTRSTTEA